jgi:adenylate cyclase
LRFVVEQTLLGLGERLKGYTIAVEVFGRPPDFDAQTDPLVRVEAGRLRRRLIEYYADEGRDDPVRIELPRGSYAVVTKYHASSQAADVAGATGEPASIPAQAASENDTARARRLWRRFRTVVLAAAVVVGAVAIFWRPRGVAPPPERADTSFVERGVAGRPSILVVPFEALGGAEDAAELAATLTEEILLVLDGPETLVVPAVGNGTATVATPGYALNGSVREANGQARIMARVVRTDTGTQLWSAAYDEPLDALRSAGGQRRIARLVALVAEPYGSIFEAEAERMRAAGAHEPSTRECLLRYYEYRRAFAAAAHAAALECFEQAVKHEPDSAQAWAGLSLLVSDAWAHGFAGQAGQAAALERAREAARRAMDIDGDSLHANLALTAVQYFSGAEFREGAERILARWPENAEAQAMLGAMFLLSGETSRGASLVEAAIEWTPEVPSGYHASRALAALREQRHSDALESALRIDAPDWSLGYAIVAAAAALGGRADLADRARARAIELDAKMATSLSDVLRRWRVEPVLAGELERAFAVAGG